jgi:hypothetical protein
VLRARALHVPVFLGSLYRKIGRYAPPAHHSFAARLVFSLSVSTTGPSKPILICVAKLYDVHPGKIAVGEEIREPTKQFFSKYEFIPTLPYRFNKAFLL